MAEPFNQIDRSIYSAIPYTLKQQPAKDWLKQKFNSLSIRQQIYLGYTMTMAIAILGTTTGFLISHQYQKQAYERLLLAQAQEKLLSDLEMTRWEIPFDSKNNQNIPTQNLAEFQEQKNKWLSQIYDLQQDLLEIQFNQSINSQKYPIFTQFEKSLKAYTEEIEIISQQIKALEFKPEEFGTAQQLLLNFSEKPAVQEFNRLFQQLHQLTHEVNKEEIALTLVKANNISQQLIFGSLLISVLFSIGLAIYTSRAIAHSLEEVTKVAQRITKESNFSLKFPVKKHDKLGRLSTSLNELMYRIKYRLEELEKEKETQLMQSEKMASLGKMLAGVAHEVNNPINFIYGNIAPAREYIQDIFYLIETYKTEVSNPPEAVATLTESIDLDFVQEDLMKILKSMELGAERAREIVVTLKNFSRLDDELAHPVNLHDCIDSTLIMLDNQIKKGITVVKNYGEIPAIESYIGLMYQVFMNLLNNAMDALEKKLESKHNPTITITTEICDFDSEYVMVKIADNGTGIEEEKQEKIFKTFFTTKERGIGTGLGLAITRKIVEEKHSGKLNCHSEVGEGTEFSIILPIKYQISDHS